METKLQTTRFLLNEEALIENFTDRPEKLRDIVPLITELERSLVLRGYNVICARNHTFLPDMITIRQNDIIEENVDIKGPMQDFDEISSFLGIKSLFDFP